jgi:hypothetical protein
MQTCMCYYTGLQHKSLNTHGGKQCFRTNVVQKNGTHILCQHTLSICLRILKKSPTSTKGSERDKIAMLYFVTGFLRA